MLVLLMQCAQHCTRQLHALLGKCRVLLGSRTATHSSHHMPCHVFHAAD
jgi:hypothetical protein